MRTTASKTFLRPMLVFAATLASATACGTSGTNGATDAVSASGVDVENCVEAWSGYGGRYDDRSYHEAAVIRARWRCTLVNPREGEREWCFTWADGSDASDLGFPASLELAGEKSC